MKTENIFILIAIVAFLGAFVLFIKYQKEQQVIGNKVILTEINNLLLPIYTQNVTVNDFNNLKYMVRNDESATEKVNELITLAYHKEYTYMGSDMGSLYEYIQTGKENICPGQALAHYFVFLKYKENHEAILNLNNAKTQLNSYAIFVKKTNNSSSSDSYKVSLDLINLTLQKIESGDNSTNDEQISFLSQAPCIK